jgi:hypothetical protein
MLTRALTACLLPSALALALASPALAAEGYRFVVSQPDSSVTYQFNASLPFTGSLIGTNDPMALPAAQTRTKRMASIFSCGTFGATQNDAITVSGSISSTGSSPTPTNIRPSGTFALGFDPVANTSFARSVNLQLLATGALSVNASLANFSYQSFCTVNPSCNAPFLFAITLPLGSISITSIQLTQLPGDALGTLTPTGPDAWTFSIPLTATLTPAATFSGAPLTLASQDLPIVLAGSITRTPAGVVVSSSFTASFAPPVDPTPTVLPPTPFAVPADSALCPNINITLNLTTASAVTTLSSTSMLTTAPGTRIPCPCDANASGSITVQDIFEFLALWFLNDPRADINAVGGITVQDIFDFLACWFNPPREC